MNTRPIYRGLLLGVLLLGAMLRLAGQTDSLGYYLELAGKSSPKLQASLLKYKAALERVPQAGAWKDPEVEIGFFTSPMATMGGKQVGDVKLMQMFPWFGTLSAAKDEMTRMAQMEYESFRAERDDLYLRIATAWFRLANLEDKVRLLQASQSKLSSIHTLAQRRFASPRVGRASSAGRSASASSAMSTPPTSSSNAGAMGGMSGMAMGSGSGSSTPQPQGGNMGGMAQMSGSGMGMPASGGGMSSLLGIQIEQAELETQIQELRDEQASLHLQLASLIGIEPSALHRPSKLHPQLIDLDSTQLLLKIQQDNPMLAMLEAERLALDAKAKMDRKMGLPMIGVGVQYMVIAPSGMASAGHKDGMDMVMPMVSFTLPIWRSKYRAQQRETKLRKQAVDYSRQETLLNLRSELDRRLTAVRNAERRIKLLEEQTTLAERVYNLGLTEYATDKLSLSDLLEQRRDLLRYAVERNDALEAYNTAVVSIHQLLSIQ